MWNMRFAGSARDSWFDSSALHFHISHKKTAERCCTRLSALTFANLKSGIDWFSKPTLVDLRLKFRRALVTLKGDNDSLEESDKLLKEIQNLLKHFFHTLYFWNSGSVQLIRSWTDRWPSPSWNHKPRWWRLQEPRRTSWQHQRWPWCRFCRDQSFPLRISPPLKYSWYVKYHCKHFNTFRRKTQEHAFRRMYNFSVIGMCFSRCFYRFINTLWTEISGCESPWFSRRSFWRRKGESSVTGSWWFSW